MKEALGFSETSVLKRATRRNIQEENILHSHSRENLKSYTVELFGVIATVIMKNAIFWVSHRSIGH
jgi:hypothetical protein